MNARTFRAEAKSNRQRTLFWLTFILLLGAGLRFFQLNAVSLRGDEAFTVLHWMREPLGQTLANIATTDPQPPLAYALYRGFGLVFGTGEGVVRILPALLNLLGIPAMYGIGKRIGGRNVGLVAAALFAVSPAVIWHAQDARNYGIWVAVSALALWLALRALERGRTIDWALFVVLQIAAAYLYYLELLFLGALTIYVLIAYRRQRRTLTRWFIALCTIALALAPWFLQPRLLNGGGYGGTAGQLDPAAYLTQFLPTLLFGQAVPVGRELWFITASLVTAAVGLILLRSTRRSAVWLLIVYAGLPLLALGLIATQLNVFVPRYVLPVALALMLLSAVVIVRGLSSANRSAPLRLLAIALPVLIVWSLLTYYSDYAKSPDWRALAGYLAPRTTSSDLLVNSAADMSFPFYLGEFAVRGEHVQLPANPNQSRSEIETTLSGAIAEDRRVWIVAQPPNWPNRAIPDDWLAANAFQILSTDIGGLRVAAYIGPSPDDGTILADFGPVQLTSVSTPDLLEPDGSLALVLTFEVSAQTGTALKAFVHVIGPTNPETGTPLWAQDDQIPRDVLDTTTWDPGLRYLDRFVLPGLDRLPPGEYSVVTGWYDPNTNERLTAMGQDAVPVLDLSVSPSGALTIRSAQN